MNKILIIDDEYVIHESLKLILGDVGCEIDSAFTPTEALNYIQTNRYQLIICDYNLPEINGIELIQYIQSKGFKGQVFLFTGNPAILALSNLYKDELIRVIEKPILDIEAFKNKILSVFLNKSMSKKYEICL